LLLAVGIGRRSIDQPHGKRAVIAKGYFNGRSHSQNSRKQKGPPLASRSKGFSQRRI
jgi:hypothetical protein